MLSTTPHDVGLLNTRSILNFILKRLKFSTQRSRKTRDFEKKISIKSMAEIAPRIFSP